MTNNNRLRLMKEDELCVILKKTEKYLPEAQAVHGILNTGYRLKGLQNYPAKVFLPESDESPFFILIIGFTYLTEYTSIATYWKKEELPNEIITEFLISIKEYIDWKKSLWLPSLPGYIAFELEEVLKHEKLCGIHQVRLHTNACCSYSALNPELIPKEIKAFPEGYTLKSLDPSDYITVYKYWRYKFGDIASSIKEMITHLPSSGIYHEGKLVSYSVTDQKGQCCFTFTLDGYKSQGFGKAVTIDLIRKQIAEGITPCVVVVDSNELVVRMHEKIGFVKTHDCYYDFYRPPGTTMVVDHIENRSNCNV